EPAGCGTGLAVHGVAPPRAILSSLNGGWRLRLLHFIRLHADGCGRPYPVSVGPPLEARTTKRGSIRSGREPAPSAPESPSSRRRIARAPSSAISTRIVVSGGST